MTSAATDRVPSRLPQRETLIGLAAALGSFLIWGVAPLYFKAIGAATPLEILAHRVLWTAFLMIGLVLAFGRGAILWRLLAHPSRLGIYLLSTLLVSVNWLLFIYAVADNRVLEASLGYYINPLVNVLLGVLFLSERLNRWQGAAVLLAMAGVLNQVLGYGAVPWVSLALAVSFGFYALVRKKAAIDPLVGLLVETLLLVPVALAYMLWIGAAGTAQFIASGWGFSLALMASSAVTAAPLILFMIGAQRLNLSTIGLLQYLAPTMQFVLAVAVFGEPFTTAHLITFACIWAGLAIYSWDAVRAYRENRRTVVTGHAVANEPAT